MPNIEQVEAVGNSTILDEWIPAGSTEITLRAPIDPFMRKSRWLVIGVGLATCEVRKLTDGASGRECAVTATTYVHNPGEVVLVVDRPRMPAEWFGVVPDSGKVSATGITNRTQIEYAYGECAAAGAVLSLRAHDYYIEFGTTVGTDDRITISANGAMEGVGRDHTTLTYGPDDRSTQLFGIRVDGVNFECRHMEFVAPLNVNLTTTNFDDLVNTTAFWINPNAVAIRVEIASVNVNQGWETSIQISGDASNGCRYTIDNCKLFAYSVPLAGSMSDDAVANEAGRYLTVRNTQMTSHLGEGNSTWDTRGRVMYVHPHFSVHVENCKFRGSGSGRPMFAMYSSSSVIWNSHPPRHARIIGCEFRRESTDPSTEAVQTTNLIGCTTYFIGCTFDVDELAARVRGNTVFQSCHFKGSTKSISAEQVGPLKTHLRVAASSGASTITVEDASIFSDTNAITIMTDDRTLHVTTVNGAPAGDVITLTDNLDDDAAVGSWVVHTVTQTGSNATTAEWIKIDSCSFENDPTPDAMIVGDTRVRIFVTGSDFQLSSADSNCGVYQGLLAGAYVYFKSCSFHFHVRHPYVLELDDGEAYFESCTFWGNANRVMQITANADRVGLYNNLSWVDSFASQGYAFMNGAAPAGTVDGFGNVFFGSAKPRMTNAQNIQMAPGLDPTSIASAATVNLPWTAYNTFEITGTTTISTLGLQDGAGGADTVIRVNHSGSVFLKFTNAAPGGITDTGNIVTKAGGASSYSQDTVAHLIHDPVNNQWSEV